MINAKACLGGVAVFTACLLLGVSGCTATQDANASFRVQQRVPSPDHKRDAIVMTNCSEKASEDCQYKFYLTGHGAVPGPNIDPEMTVAKPHIAEATPIRLAWQSDGTLNVYSDASHMVIPPKDSHASEAGAKDQDPSATVAG